MLLHLRNLRLHLGEGRCDSFVVKEKHDSVHMEEKFGIDTIEAAQTLPQAEGRITARR